MTMLHDDADVARVILDAAPAEFFKPGRGGAEFGRIVHATMTEAEAAMLDRVKTAIRSGVTNAQQSRLVGVLGGEDWILDSLILRFVRAHSRPKIVRADIAATARRVESLSRKSAEIAQALTAVDQAVTSTPEGGLNIAALAAAEAAAEVERSVADLARAMAALAAARDRALPDTGRRMNEDRIKLAAHLLVVLADEARGLADDVVRIVVETVEGPVGQGEGEWVQPLVRDARAFLDVGHLRTEPRR